MSRGNWATFVVVVEHGKQSWTVGPYHNRTLAQDCVDNAHKGGASAWIEPVYHPNEWALESVNLLTGQEP